jgi:hypothetical protein
LLYSRYGETDHTYGISPLFVGGVGGGLPPRVPPFRGDNRGVILRERVLKVTFLVSSEEKVEIVF